MSIRTAIAWLFDVGDETKADAGPLSRSLAQKLARNSRLSASSTDRRRQSVSSIKRPVKRSTRRSRLGPRGIAGCGSRDTWSP